MITSTKLFLYKILVLRTKPHILIPYKLWMRENVGERYVDWDICWYTGPHYEISFKCAEDLTAFKLRFKI